MREEKENAVLLKKGKYVFTGDLIEVSKEENSVPYFSATAIVIAENSEGQYIGDILPVKISDLILKQSAYIDEYGKNIEAHKLYIWPRNLGSTKEWTAAKQEFLISFIMHFPIEVLSTQESNGVTWRFITPENFKKLPEGITGTADFQEFASHTDEYFFLRRLTDAPK